MESKEQPSTTLVKKKSFNQGVELKNSLSKANSQIAKDEDVEKKEQAAANQEGEEEEKKESGPRTIERTNFIESKFEDVLI